MKLFPVLTLPLAVLMMTGCGPVANNTSDGGKATVTDTLSVPGVNDYSFQKIYRTPVRDTVYVDTMYLELHIEGDAVSGKYLWFIPQKDGKFGTITGTLFKDTISGYYAYQQEGGHYKDSVRILLLRDKAVVTQYNAPNSRLVDTLVKK